MSEEVWISTAEGLPTKSQPVFLFSRGRTVVGWLTDKGFVDCCGAPLVPVTHWKLFPLPPDTSRD
jgi:hypothetical protein